MSLEDHAFSPLLSGVMLAASMVFCGVSAASPAPARPLTAEEISRRATPSVVVVECYRGSTVEAFGSGFSVSSASLFLTNAHVVGGCGSISVVTRDGHRFPARTLLLDEDADIAVIQPSVPLALPALPLSTASEPRIGQRVYAIGHPEGLTFSISDGIVSALRELRGHHFVQVTAPISPGSSGGPLLDEKGNVIGMTTSHLKEGQNLNFAIPSTELSARRDQVTAWLAKGGANAADLRMKTLPAIMDARSIAAMGRRLKDSNKRAQALALLQEGAVRFPESIDILLQLTECLWELGRTEESVQFARKMIELNPACGPAYQCLGMAAILARKDYAEGRDLTMKALALELDSEYKARAYAMLSLCATEAKNYSEAIRFKELSFKDRTVDPIHAEELVGYAKLLLNVSRKADADRVARRLLKEHPSDRKSRETLEKLGLPVKPRVVSQNAERLMNGELLVSGVVTNEGSGESCGIIVTAQSFDTKDVVVATGQSLLSPGCLEPGESGSFTVSVEGNPEKGKRFAAWVSKAGD